MNLDHNTLLFSAQFSRCAYALVFIVSGLRRRSEQYIFHWAISIVLSMLGVTLTADGGMYPFTGAAQGFVIYSVFGCSIALCWSGTRVFLGRIFFWKSLAWQSLLPGVLFAAVRLLGGNPNQALVGMFLGLSWITGRTAIELLVAGLRERLPSLFLATSALALYLLTFLAFVAFSVFDRWTVSQSSAANLSLIIDQSCSILIYISFLAMAGERSALQLERLATIDPLTHLFNRRGVRASAEKTGPAPFRQEQPISVLLVDVDRFKNVNDQYGHDAGDVVLQEFARRFRNVLRRRSDIVARWGGEEFLAVLYDVPLDQAGALAEKIRVATEIERFTHGQTSIEITVSIGVAGVVPNEASIDNAIQRADRALYTAKENGRNQVCVSS